MTTKRVTDAEGRTVTCAKCATIGTNAAGPGAHAPGCPNDQKLVTKSMSMTVDKDGKYSFGPLKHGVEQFGEWFNTSVAEAEKARDES
jgi:hypothetical protein